MNNAFGIAILFFLLLPIALLGMQGVGFPDEPQVTLPKLAGQKVSEPKKLQDVVLSNSNPDGRLEATGVLDLGVVRAGELFRGTFRIKNDTDHALAFAIVKASCACTTISVPAGEVKPTVSERLKGAS